MKEHVREVNVGMKLQGYLLGYEVLQNGIVVQHHDYPVPVKNTITNVGKAALLYSDNLNTTQGYLYFSQFGSSEISSGNQGVLVFSGRGSGTTAATVSDTSLETAIGNKTSSLLLGDPNTGTRYDRENGKIIMRVTHDHESESSDQNINEIAYFGKRNSAYVIFSRIVLPSTITVLTGQQLRTIYQLDVQVSPYTSTSSAPPITGWTTDGDVRFQCDFPATSATFASVGNGLLNGVVHSTSVSPVASTGTYRYGLCPAICTSYGTAAATPGQVDQITFYGDSQTFNTFGTALTSPSASATRFNAGTNPSSGTVTVTAGSITATQTYRDLTYEFSPNWTGYPSIDIYAMNIRGLTHIFDNPVTKTNTQRLTIVYRVSVT